MVRGGRRRAVVALALGAVGLSACPTNGGLGGSGAKGGGAAGGATGAAGMTSSGGTGGGAGAGAQGSAGAKGSGGSPSSSGGAGGAMSGLGPFTGLDFGAVSHGGTLTFQNIGAAGSYPSICAPTSAGACCRQAHVLDDDRLTPWNEELIMTLRGPMVVKQLAVYQPSSSQSGAPWRLASAWDARAPAAARGIAFTGDATPKTPLGQTGTIGSVCVVNASTDQAFGCGPNSSPYCPASAANHHRGWSGSKLFVLLASMPHVDAGGAATVASTDSCAASSNGWTDAPWLGLSVGELIRAGAFSQCQCYEVTQYHGDGCGQFNAFEVINDNDTSGTYRNLEVFSSNFFGYGGDFGGPCGVNTCDTTGLDAAVDLVSKRAEAGQGGLASQTPRTSPSAFFRRPSGGFRYFLILLDVDARTVQLAVVHPQNVPPPLAPLLPTLPGEVSRAAIDGLLQLRLPR